MKLNFQYPDKFDLCMLPTPIVPLSRFFNEKQECKVWLKRDDLTGLELSGNKVRKLEFIAKDAVKKGANHLLTCGGLQSNHCRTTAFVAAQLGLKSTVFLRGIKTENGTGNYLMNQIVGANIEYVTPDEYKRIDAIMSDYANKINKTGNVAYVIPEGGSNEVGAWGYIQCFTELKLQIKNQNLPIDTVVVATGSGGTHAGLLLGKLLTESALDVISVNVCDSAKYFQDKIHSIINKFSANNNINLNVKPDDIKIIDGFVGEGYGLITEKEVSVIKRFAEAEGIILDPVYSAKAFLGLEHVINEKLIISKNVLFIHTGGIFGLFPNAEHF